MNQRRKSAWKAAKPQPPAPGKIKTSPRQKLVTIGVIALALLFVASMFLSGPANFSKRVSPPSNTNIPAPAGNARPAEPQFVKEGELHFVRKNQVVATIEIEVAGNAQEIEQGLMYRQRMDENKGMLFIFPNMQPRGFWMKNTLFPLDIIYVDDEKTIVSIQKNTTPLSEQNLPSDGDAQYVVEVNAGFSDRYNLEAGDKIDFILF